MKIVKKLLPVIFILAFFFLPTEIFASNLYLSPGSGSIGVGNNLAVSVRLNTGGDQVNGVSANLSYPTDKLDVTYVTGGSSFAIEAEKSFGGGTIRISRGSINPVSGNVTVATIGFKGKAIGSATVAFIGGSAAPRASDSSDSLNLGGSTGGVYNIVKAAAKVPASQSTSTPAPATAIQLIAQKPKISDIKVINIGTNTATITWKTDKPADSMIDYGLEKGKYFIIASDNNLVTEHSINLPGQILTSGTKFYFRILAKDAEGNIGQSDDTEFQLLNLPEKSEFNLKSFSSTNTIIIVLVLVVISVGVGFIIWKKKRGIGVLQKDKQL